MTPMTQISRTEEERTKKGKHGIFLAVWFCVYAMCGCSGLEPRWHSGRKHSVTHALQEASVFEEGLSVRGSISPVCAFTDYGIKVYSARDDTGNDLALRSFQVFYAKVMRFEIEFESPADEAETVTLDIAFTTRSGLQRLKETLPIDRLPCDNFTSRRHVWAR